MSSILKNTDPARQPSFTLTNRIARLGWNIVYTLLFKYSPKPLHSWRALLLRLFGAKIGKGCHIYPKAKIWAPWNLIMKDYAGIANDVNCYNMAKVELGYKSVISQGVNLCTGTHDYESPNFQLIAKPIKVKDKAWVSAEAFVHPGVTIGEGAVIGARSVVTKDMPAWMVCAGVPCKAIKERKIRNE